MIAFRVAMMTLLTSAFACPTEQTKERPVIANLHLEKVQLTSLDADAAEFEFTLAGSALKTVSVKSIFFEQLSVNGIPLHATPVYEKLQLKEGKEVDSFPTVQAHVAFREIHSLQPLRDIMADGKARIHASVLVQLELNPIEMLALRSLDAWGIFEIDTDQHVEAPGGVLGQAAGFAALTAAEPLWILSNEAREWRRQHSVFCERAQDAMQKNLATIDCRFVVRSEQGNTTEVHNQSMGFLLPSGKLLTTAEALQPWKFDSALAESLGRHKAFRVSDSIEVRVKLAGSEREFSTLRNEIRVLGSRQRGVLLFSEEQQSSYHLQLRNDKDNLAVLELQRPNQSESDAQSMVVESDSEWQPAALFNLSTHPIVFMTEVRWEHGRILLKEPVPPAAFGSPVWVANGVAGIVQTEDSAADRKTVRDAFPAEKL